MSCCLDWVILEERLSVRVLASAVDDWLLCRVEGFVSYLLVHRGVGLAYLLFRYQDVVLMVYPHV